MWIIIDTNQDNWDEETLPRIRYVYMRTSAAMFRATYIDSTLILGKFASGRKENVEEELKAILDALEIKYSEKYTLESIIQKYLLLGSPIGKELLQSLRAE